MESINVEMPEEASRDSRENPDRGVDSGLLERITDFFHTRLDGALGLFGGELSGSGNSERGSQLTLTRLRQKSRLTAALATVLSVSTPTSILVYSRDAHADTAIDGETCLAGISYKIPYSDTKHPAWSFEDFNYNIETLLLTRFPNGQHLGHIEGLLRKNQNKLTEAHRTKTFWFHEGVVIFLDYYDRELCRLDISSPDPQVLEMQYGISKKEAEKLAHCYTRQPRTAGRTTTSSPQSSRQRSGPSAPAIVIATEGSPSQEEAAKIQEKRERKNGEEREACESNAERSYDFLIHCAIFSIKENDPNEGLRFVGKAISAKYGKNEFSDGEMQSILSRDVDLLTIVAFAYEKMGNYKKVADTLVVIFNLFPNAYEQHESLRALHFRTEGKYPVTSRIESWKRRSRTSEWVKEVLYYGGAIIIGIALTGSDQATPASTPPLAPQPMYYPPPTREEVERSDRRARELCQADCSTEYSGCLSSWGVTHGDIPETFCDGEKAKCNADCIRRY